MHDLNGENSRATNLTTTSNNNDKVVESTVNQKLLTDYFKSPLQIQRNLIPTLNTTDEDEPDLLVSKYVDVIEHYPTTPAVSTADDCSSAIDFGDLQLSRDDDVAPIDDTSETAQCSSGLSDSPNENGPSDTPNEYEAPDLSSENVSYANTPNEKGLFCSLNEDPTSDSPNENGPSDSPSNNGPSCAPNENGASDSPDANGSSCSPNETRTSNSPNEPGPSDSPNENRPSCSPNEHESTNSLKENEPSDFPSQNGPSDSPNENGLFCFPTENRTSDSPNENRRCDSPDVNEPMEINMDLGFADGYNDTLQDLEGSIAEAFEAECTDDSSADEGSSKDQPPPGKPTSMVLPEGTNPEGISVFHCDPVAELPASPRRLSKRRKKRTDLYGSQKRRRKTTPKPRNTLLVAKCFIPIDTGPKYDAVFNEPLPVLKSAIKAQSVLSLEPTTSGAAEISVALDIPILAVVTNDIEMTDVVDRPPSVAKVQFDDDVKVEYISPLKGWKPNRIRMPEDGPGLPKISEKKKLDKKIPVEFEHEVVDEKGDISVVDGLPFCDSPGAVPMDPKVRRRSGRFELSLPSPLEPPEGFENPVATTIDTNDRRRSQRLHIPKLRTSPLPPTESKPESKIRLQKRQLSKNIQIGPPKSNTNVMANKALRKAIIIASPKLLVKRVKKIQIKRQPIIFDALMVNEEIKPSTSGTPTMEVEEIIDISPEVPLPTEKVFSSGRPRRKSAVIACEKIAEHVSWAKLFASSKQKEPSEEKATQKRKNGDVSVNSGTTKALKKSVNDTRPRKTRGENPDVNVQKLECDKNHRVYSLFQKEKPTQAEKVEVKKRKKEPPCFIVSEVCPIRDISWQELTFKSNSVDYAPYLKCGHFNPSLSSPSNAVVSEDNFVPPTDHSTEGLVITNGENDQFGCNFTAVITASPSCSRKVTQLTELQIDGYLSRSDDHRPEIKSVSKMYELFKKYAPVNGGDSSVSDYSLWSERYRPRKIDEVIGLENAKFALLEWLTMWKRRLEITRKKSEKKKAAPRQSTSRSASVDSDDDDDDVTGDNLVLLCGPSGCGKTCLTYALAKQLGYAVIELNASSPRDGRTISSRLEGAMLSHRVASGVSTASSIFSPTPSKDSVQPSTTTDSVQQNTVILLKDVHLVFEEDENFWPALQTLVQDSRTPVIMTAKNRNFAGYLSVQDLCKVYEVKCPPMSKLSTAMQAISLVHHRVLLQRNALVNLCRCMKGDLRACLQILQFWLGSCDLVPSSETDMAPIESNAVNLPEWVFRTRNDHNVSIYRSFLESIKASEAQGLTEISANMDLNCSLDHLCSWSDAVLSRFNAQYCDNLNSNPNNYGSYEKSNVVFAEALDFASRKLSPLSESIQSFDKSLILPLPNREKRLKLFGSELDVDFRIRPIELASDVLPSLRCIGMIQEQLKALNTKRRGFQHYFDKINLDPHENIRTFVNENHF